MNVRVQIDDYISSQAASKRDDLHLLDQTIRRISPQCRLWYLDGRNAEGKIVSNPNIGYGLQLKTYADGKTGEFYQVGISANTSGISIYLMGIADKSYLRRVYDQKIGKAKITGYCIKFKNLSDVNLDIIEEMIANHFSRGATGGA